MKSFKEVCSLTFSDFQKVSARHSSERSAPLLQALEAHGLREEAISENCWTENDDVEGFSTGFEPKVIFSPWKINGNAIEMQLKVNRNASLIHLNSF